MGAGFDSLMRVVLPMLGSYFGPIGYIVGALIGSLFFSEGPPDAPKPRDLDVQTNEYGSTITRHFGKGKMAGNIIHVTEIEEIAIYDKTGDIFGIGGNTFLKSWLVRSVWAVAFCQGPVEEVTKIYGDGLLIYDITLDATVAERRASRAKLTATTNGIRIYLGTEDQGVDPTLAALVGTDKVPAYRGMVYIVFLDYNLEPFDYRRPTIIAEVVQKKLYTPDRWVDISSEFEYTGDGEPGDLTFLNYTITGPVGTWTGLNVGQVIEINRTDITDYNTGAVTITGIDATDEVMTVEREEIFTYVDSSTNKISTTGLPTTAQENRRNLGVTVGNDKLWMLGGYKKSSGEHESVWYADIDSNGNLEWTQSVSLPQGRAEIDLIGWPGTNTLTSERIIVMGGRSGGTDFWDEPPFSDMMLSYQPGGAWQQIICAGDNSYAAGRIPFPRSGYAAAYSDALRSSIHSSGIVLYGGRNQNGAHLLGWEGIDNSFQDLWTYDGTVWFLHTRIEDGVSEDGGGGYRWGASICDFKGVCYMAGGVEAGFPNPALRDVLKLVDAGVVNVLKRFAKTNLDIMSGWPDTDEVYIGGLKVWHGKLVAVVNDNRPGYDDFMLWESTDGISFSLMASAILNPITGSGTTYTFDGDITDSIVVGDRLVTRTASSFWQQDVVSVEVVADDTVVEVDVLADVADTVYVLSVKGTATTNQDNLPRSVEFEVFDGQMYLLGGGVDAGAENDENQVYRINESSVAAPPTLAEIISPLAIEAGLRAGEIDVSGLTETIHGYSFNNRPMVRAVIEELRKYGLFDCIESDAQMQFPLRGRTPDVTIPSTELAVRPANKKESPGKLILTRREDIELPERIDVIYRDSDADYEKGVQTAQRSTSVANKPVTVNTNMFMSAERAAVMADILLQEGWMARDNLAITVGWEYAHLDPADMVQITVEGITAIGRIQSLKFARPGVITIEMIADDTPAIYTPVPTGVSLLGNTRRTLLKPFETTGLFVDSAIFAEGDDDHGFYMGLAPTDADDEDDWPGARVYVRNEENYLTDEWAYVAGRAVLTPWGNMDEILPNAQSTNWDRGTKLLVTLVVGELVSATEERVRAGANLAAVGSTATGWELLQFADVEDLGSNQYRLRNLLRGRWGTEHATGTHIADEQFILMDRDTLMRMKMSRAGVGREVSYRIVPVGKEISEYTSVTFTNNAVGKKPYSPVHVTAEKQTDGTWRIEWQRRVRGVVGWIGVPMPLNETFEQYEIEFYNGSTVEHIQEIRILSSNPGQLPFYDFSTQQQVAIYGAEQSTLHVKIYQVSMSIGRGYPAEVIA